MAQIPPIDDAYINEIIKSNGPYNPSLLKTQGTKMRELIKLLRDRMEQGDSGAVKTTGDQSISGTKTFTLLKAEGISVNNLANPALNTVISPVNGVETKLLNLNEGLFAVQLAASGLSALRSQTLQDKSGVIALTSDVHDDRFNPIAGTGISLNGTYPDITINTTGIDSTPDATTLIRGKIRLSGDLAGNADAPTVPELLNKISLSQKGIANGVATLGTDGKIPNSQIPAFAISNTFVIASQAAMLALSGADQGDVAVRTDINKSFILTASPASTLNNWQELLTPTDAVSSVDGQVGNVNLTTSYIANSTALQTSNFNISGIGKMATLNLSAAPVNRSEATAQVLVRNSTTGSIEKIVGDNTSMVRANGTTVNIDSAVKTTLLNGLVTGTNTPITSSNTVLTGLANLQAQISGINLDGYLTLSGGTLTGGLNGTTGSFSGKITGADLVLTGGSKGIRTSSDTFGVEYYNITSSSPGSIVHKFTGFSGTELISIRNNGQVGIGVPNPIANLDVKGKGKFSEVVIAPKISTGLIEHVDSNSDLQQILFDDDEGIWKIKSILPGATTLYVDGSVIANSLRGNSLDVVGSSVFIGTLMAVAEPTLGGHLTNKTYVDKTVGRMFTYTTSGDGTTYEWTIPHSLDYTPTMVLVTANSSDASLTVSSLSLYALTSFAKIDGSNIKITCWGGSGSLIMPDAGTNNLTWTIWVK